MFLLEWLLTGSVTQLVLAIIARDTRVVLERWLFDVTIQEPPPAEDDAPYVVFFACFHYLIDPAIQSPSKGRGNYSIRDPQYSEANCGQRDIPSEL